MQLPNGEVVPFRGDMVIPENLRGYPDVLPTDRASETVLGLIGVPYYDVDTIARIERELANISLTLPASRSPDISSIFGVIEQITQGRDLYTIHSFLSNTSENTARARADLQRCGSLLQKISGIPSNSGTTNWPLIFSRLELEQKAA